ncbi:hypothetical protein V6N12_067019 [Hibiscus sabdariffa]|uniref:Putative plant transposon protein domain-containing protein n=1 Tax=Hibiscus sabdariffa TaxID=183260 RepID=A0ABR2BKW9_9ROSI
MANNSAKYTMVAAKNKWEEQGFHFDDSLPNYGLEQFVYNRLHELGWFRFARQPARANYNWAIEFYVNNAAGEDFSTVRGRRVPATAATINAILDLPNDDPSFYAMLGALEDEDFEQIKDFLCEAGTAWNTTGRNPHSVSRPSLRPDAKLWNTFVKRNIMPTSHNQTVDRTWLLLIHTILTGYRINVGEILAKELAAACANDKGILAFPCLISALCRRAAVPAYQDDKLQAEKKGWTRAVYMRKMDVADATPLNMAMPTPPASPDHMPTAPSDEAGPSNPATASSAPAEPRQPSADSPPVVPVVSNTTTSPAATPANMPASRESTPTSPLGSIPEAPHSPPPAQSDEAAPLHILQLRNQLERIETRQLQMQEETKQQQLPTTPPTHSPYHLPTPLLRPATQKKFISHQMMRMTFLTGRRPEAIHQHPAQLNSKRQQHQQGTAQIQLMFQFYNQPLSRPNLQWRPTTGERARLQLAA